MRNLMYLLRMINLIHKINSYIITIYLKHIEG
jgi:hypothetical protein